MKEPPGEGNPAANLSDDIIVEILRLLPVRSLCRFNSVSRSWNTLIFDPRQKLPQTLAGFFYMSFNGERCPMRAHHFTNATGKGIPFIYPSFSFLPVPSSDVTIVDSCNGLLLCRCYAGPRANLKHRPFHYAVCNPANEKWLMLPDSSRANDEHLLACLAFNPAVSSHFSVIEYVQDETECISGVEIYSSKTAAWSFKESQWGPDVMLPDKQRSVFLNGFMHMISFACGLVAVDMKGKAWRTIPVPCDGESGFIYQAKGRLCFINVDNDEAYTLSIWILEDYGTDEWILKHKAALRVCLEGRILIFDLAWTMK